MNVGFIGGGNMAYAILAGGLSAGVLSPNTTIVSDPSPDRRRIVSELNVDAVEDNAAVCERAELIFLCIKPQQLAAGLEPVRSAFNPKKHCLASILAGAPTRRIESLLPDGLPVVRVMPNTPMLIGQGVSAVCGGRYATDAHIQTVVRVLEATSQTLLIDESMMDAVTAVSGSGPAYLFYVAEALIDAAVGVGFDIQTAELLVRGTLSGAANLLKQSDRTAAELRSMVTSKGGTTAAATAVFDVEQIRDAFARAVQAARDRSIELGKG